MTSILFKHIHSETNKNHACQSWSHICEYDWYDTNNYFLSIETYACIYAHISDSRMERLVRSYLTMEDNTRQVCLQNWTWEKREKRMHIYNHINFVWFCWFLIWLYCTICSMHYLINHKTFPNCHFVSIYWTDHPISTNYEQWENFAYIRKMNNPFFKCIRKIFTVNIYRSIYFIIYFNIPGETINIDVKLTLSSMEPLQIYLSKLLYTKSINPR